jgi:hypothetical protein
MCSQKCARPGNSAGSHMLPTRTCMVKGMVVGSSSEVRSINKKQAQAADSRHESTRL